MDSQRGIEQQNPSSLERGVLSSKNIPVQNEGALTRGGTPTQFHNNKAFVLQRAGEFAWENRQEQASCASRDILVRIIATGICGSDIHFWQHGRIGNCVVTSPVILGHESAGVIESCGPDVVNLVVGDRVAIEPGISCTTCEACRSGKYNLCESMRFAATPPIDGTLSTFYRVPEECCFKLPQQISFEEGALVEPLSVAVHCCKLAEVAPCSSVTVFGAGPIGLLCCAVAKAFGASRILVADVVQPRLNFAQEYAQTATYCIGQEGNEGFSRDLLLSKICCPKGSDVVIDATGAESCIDYGLQVIKRGGVYVQAGLGPSRINFPIDLICSKEVIFKGSYRYGPGDYKLAIDLLSTRKVSVKELISNRYDFADAEQAFIDSSKKLGIKNVIFGPSVSSRSNETLKSKI